MTESEYSRRRALALSALADRKLDALLISSPASVRYLTGFAGSNGLLLISHGTFRLFTDPRYKLQAASATGCRVSAVRGSLFRAAAMSLGAGRPRLGFNPRQLTHEAFLELTGVSAARLRLLPDGGLVETLRMTKSPQEIELLRLSARLNSEALARSLPAIRPGVRELDLAAEIDHHSRRLGAEKPAFETIVAFGARSAMPHASPGPKILTRNELVLIDMGAFCQGYASDMTRMAFAGIPGRRVRKLYAAVLEAQLAALHAVREGVTAGSVDRAARRVLRKHGLERAFAHSCGHGLGLEIHESPRLGRGDKTRLQAGMAVTVEPGVYLQEFGGIRIEDTVVVTRNGCEILTPTSKELLTV
ncbi:MAG: M24 family metallopeptidase [Bryobacteraceae bacterium]